MNPHRVTDSGVERKFLRATANEKSRAHFVAASLAILDRSRLLPLPVSQLRYLGAPPPFASRARQQVRKDEHHQATAGVAEDPRVADVRSTPESVTR